MDKQLYIHYGSDHFDPTRFKVKNRDCPWSKPLGGFWASRIDDKYGWRQWCIENELWKEKPDEIPQFIFSLKDGANVYTINNSEDLHKLPKLENDADTDLMLFSILSDYTIDFEQCLKDGIDAIEVPDFYGDKDLYWELYGWDCNCILILNPDVIKEEKA